MKRIKFPDYNIIKELPKSKRHGFKVFDVLPNAYFRFIYNEEDNKMISLDYLLNGYLEDYYIANKYSVNTFYKLNQKNYLELEKLANKIFDDIINRITKKEDFSIVSY